MFGHFNSFDDEDDDGVAPPLPPDGAGPAAEHPPQHLSSIQDRHHDQYLKYCALRVQEPHPYRDPDRDPHRDPVSAGVCELVAERVVILLDQLFDLIMNQSEKSSCCVTSGLVFNNNNNNNNAFYL